MSARTTLLAVALVFLAAPALGALVAEPPAGGAGPDDAFAIMAPVEPIEKPREVGGLAGATMAAPLPAGVTAVGAALLGLGLVFRRR